MIEFIDYYKILQVNFSADLEVIEAAFRKLSSIYHPDINKYPNTEEKYKIITEAYFVLKDPEKRKRYDEIYNRFTNKVIKKSKPLKKILIPVAVVFIILLISVFGVIYFKYYSNNSSTSTISTTIIESSPVLAVVNDASIKQNTVDIYVEFLKNQDPASVPADNTPEFKTLQANILDSLIVLKVLEDYADKNNFKVTQKEIDDAYQNIVKNYPSESDFEKDLVAKKISKDFLMDQVSSQVLRDKIFTDATKNITVSDAEVKQYYDDHKDEYIKDFSEVTDTIKSYLLNNVQTSEWEKFVSDLILKTNIKYTTDLKGTLLDINN